MTTITPSSEQQAIIDFPLKPLRVDAGAGTGKTTTMALRLARLLNTGQVDAALGITFTNKASQELRERIETMRSSPDLGAVEVATYHGFAHSLLSEFGAYVGVERTARLITPGFVRQLMRDSLGKGTYEALDLAAPGYRVEEMAALSGQLSDNLGHPGRVEPLAGDVGAKRAELLEALERYEQLKREIGVVDYGDLIRLAHRLLDEVPAVVAQIRNRFQVVLLDEYQDTNPAQRELLRLVFGDGFPVTAVGDADQTIYEWRGASLENFAEFPSHFPDETGPAVTLPLTLNRRSDIVILDAANAIAGQITSRAGEFDLAAVDGAATGEVGHGWFRTADDEAQWVADSILEASAAGTGWGEIAIIFRKNAQIPLVRGVLAAAGIPVQVVSLGGLLQVPEVTDLWAWLRILDDPSDGSALLRVLLGSHFQLGLGDLMPLARWVRDQTVDAGASDDDAVPGFSLLEAAFAVEDFERDGVTEIMGRFRRLYERLVEDAQGVTLVELCRRILTSLGVWIEVEALEDAASRSARLNLYRFLDLAESWSPLEGRPSLTAFLGYLGTLLDESAPEELDLARVAEADAVTLITAHRAKGLEWDVVFLPAVVQDTFPARLRAFDDPFSRPSSLPYSARLDAAVLPVLDPDDEKGRKALLRPRHLDQEWRTAYVAATRARHRLLVSGAFWYGQKRPKKPSALFDLITDLPGAVTHATCEEPGERPTIAAATEGIPAPDPHFSDGWETALRSAIADPAWPTARTTNRAAYDDQVDQLSLVLGSLPEPATGEGESPSTTSVSGLVTYATCPKRFYWSEVDRLPRRPAPWLKRGVELHRKIELHNRGVVPLDLAEDDSYDFVPDEAEPRADAYVTFQESRFAEVKPRWIEAPFLLASDDLRIRGRIDAVYDTAGTWEVVDFKSGRHRPDPARAVQLQAYAVAVDEGALSGERPDAFSVTFAYFGDGLEEVTETVDDAWLDTARDRITGILSGINDEQFEPSPSAACHHCDFAKFCEAGQAWLAENE
ncbi:MAG: ATP-dependent helicase [Acidimicrobiia bacterium]|nr:ATP-dependent helicase [Acidimicrobiia bacterium]NNL14659.1 ATP-dependent helicase [Acidimicrobiia bacterium]